ncbi:MAG: histone deacetylase family protein [Planctomycetota bacterium]|jgi:acetoin utilization deacetylase AcuC-like enzyme
MSESTPSSARTGFVCDELYKKHLTGPGHPESPARLDAITEALAAEQFQGRLVKLTPRPARPEEILTCHEREYFDYVKARIEAGAPRLDADTGVCRDSFDAAMLAAGGVMAAVDAVLASRVPTAFCAVRPPGHHATPARAMGFCIFNNVAIAARYAQINYRLERVLIADWDVHHGNGTQEIFYEDPSVLYFSTHLWPWYPGTGLEGETGRGKARGTKINRPFPPGAGGSEIVEAFGELADAADKFAPELVLVSAGFDSRVGDPLGRLGLTDEDFAALSRICLEIARKHARGRLVSALEGGYNLDGLASAVAAHVKALCGM